MSDPATTVTLPDQPLCGPQVRVLMVDDQLQDLVMPDIDAFDAIRQYREHPVLRNVPVIVLSAREDPQVKAHSFGVGANDYLVKMPDRIELLARLRYHSACHLTRLERDEAVRLLGETRLQLAEANLALQQPGAPTKAPPIQGKS